jgi:hypothetical protein
MLAGRIEPLNAEDPTEIEKRRQSTEARIPG